MADINREVVYNDTQKALILTKEKDSSFVYSNWSDEDLIDLRGFIRDYYRIEQLGKCSYCRKDISLVSASNCHVEHIVPKSLHREFIFLPKNLCVICADCNEIKRNQETLNEVIDTVTRDNIKRYPRSSNGFKIVHPHFDNYDEHILIVANSYYLDRTSKGHFTIGVCKLNRKLHEFGWPIEIVNNVQIINAINAYLGAGDNVVAQFQAFEALRGIFFNV